MSSRSRPAGKKSPGSRREIYIDVGLKFLWPGEKKSRFKGLPGADFGLDHQNPNEYSFSRKSAKNQGPYLAHSKRSFQGEPNGIDLKDIFPLDMERVNEGYL